MVDADASKIKLITEDTSKWGSLLMMLIIQIRNRLFLL